MTRRITIAALASALTLGAATMAALAAPQDVDSSVGAISRAVNPFVPPVLPASDIVLGRQAEMTGRIPDSARNDVFQTWDPIYIGLREQVRPGTPIDVEVYDPSRDRVAWRTRAFAPPLGNEASVRIDPGRLEPGRYVVRVSVARADWSLASFRVSSGRGGDD
jgi:hypothetical protein